MRAGHRGQGFSMHLSHQRLIKGEHHGEMGDANFVVCAMKSSSGVFIKNISGCRQQSLVVDQGRGCCLRASFIDVKMIILRHLSLGAIVFLLHQKHYFAMEVLR